jgi:hypothetical protein
LIDLSRMSERLQTLWLRLTTADVSVLCLTVFLTSTAVLLGWRLFTQLEIGDAAIWDYVAQSILRGQVPYRDVVEIKGPGSAYLSAAAMWLGKSVGLRDVIAVRLMQIVLTGVLSAVTYLVTEIYLRQRTAALIAFLFPLMSDHFVSWVEAGTQPKLTMILFGMLTLLMIAKDRPFWAGFASMLSCLCWQPGLLFAGVAFLVFTRYLTSWRDLRVVKLMAGALIPLAIVVAYFYSVGALSDLWIWTVAYNFSVYAPDGMRGMSDMLAHVWMVVLRVLGVYVIWVVLALAGILMFSVERIRTKLKLGESLRSSSLFKDALLIAPVVYFAFCLINFQSGPDLLPLFPFIGIFAGFFITELARLAKPRAVKLKPSSQKSIEMMPAFVLLLVFLVTVVRAATYRSEDWSLSYQDKQLKLATDLIGPDDKVYVHGTVELLVLLNRPNLSPDIMWDHGKVDYVAARKYGGSVGAMIDEIQNEHPKMVALSRLRHVPHGAKLQQWTEEHYEKLPITGYDIYIAKPQ